MIDMLFLPALALFGFGWIARCCCTGGGGELTIFGCNSCLPNHADTGVPGDMSQWWQVEVSGIENSPGGVFTEGTVPPCEDCTDLNATYIFEIETGALAASGVPISSSGWNSAYQAACAGWLQLPGICDEGGWYDRVIFGLGHHNVSHHILWRMVFFCSTSPPPGVAIGSTEIGLFKPNPPAATIGHADCLVETTLNVSPAFRSSAQRCWFESGIAAVATPIPAP